MSKRERNPDDDIRHGIIVVVILVVAGWIVGIVLLFIKGER